MNRLAPRSDSGDVLFSALAGSDRTGDPHPSRPHVLSCLGALLALLLAGCSSQPLRKPEPVLRLAVDASHPLLQLPVYAAVRERLFAGERLRIELQECRDGNEVAALVAGGRCQFGAAGFTPVLKACAEGHALTAFLLESRSPMLVLVSAGRMKVPRGGEEAAKVGIVRAGDSTDLFAHYLTRGTTVAKGSMDEVARAFQRREVPVAVLDPVAAQPFAMRPVPPLILADTRTLAGLLATYGVSYYPGSCVFSEPAWMAENEDHLRRFSKAMAGALEWIRRRDASEVIKVLPEAYRGSVDPAALYFAVDQVRPLFSPDGGFPAEAADAARKVLAASDPRFRSRVVPLATYTSKYVSRRP